MSNNKVQKLETEAWNQIYRNSMIFNFEGEINVVACTNTAFSESTMTTFECAEKFNSVMRNASEAINLDSYQEKLIMVFSKRYSSLARRIHDVNSCID